MTAVISGRVLDEHGDALQEARVAVESAPVSLPDVALLTDAQGAFTLGAPVPGRYRITVWADGYAPAGEDVTVGSAPASLTIRLRRAS